MLTKYKYIKAAAYTCMKEQCNIYMACQNI